MKFRLNRLHAPASGEGEDLPGSDFGDDFAPTDEAAEKNKSEAAAKGDPAADKTGGTETEGAAEGEGDVQEGLLAEGATEGESEGEANAEGKPATATPKAGKGKFIPIDRHNAVLKKERERREVAEAQLAQSQAGRRVAEHNEDLERIENDLVELEKQFNAKLSEGDTDGARELQTAIRHKNADLMAATLAQREQTVLAQAVERVRYEETVDRIEAAFPVLDKDSEEFDEEVLTDVIALMNSYEASGLSATKALQRAVDRLLKPATAAQEHATSVTPRVSEADVAAERKAAAVKRNIDAQKRTPPAQGSGNGTSGGQLGGGLTGAQLKAMSDEDFDKLSDRDLAKIRGDEL